MDRSAYEWATDMAKSYEESLRTRLANFDADARGEERKKRGQCKACFHLKAGSIAGQACTTRQCGLCATVIMHGNTNCPVLCPACAAKMQLCTQCGGDLNMKTRRKLDLQPTESLSED